jgi:hypothetical protein
VEAQVAINAIKDELMRLCARGCDAGPVDAITVQDRGGANAVLLGSLVREDFNWFGPTTEILQRLRGLPDNSGPEVIRSEFAT